MPLVDGSSNFLCFLAILMSLSLIPHASLRPPSSQQHCVQAYLYCKPALLPPLLSSLQGLTWLFCHMQWSPFLHITLWWLLHWGKWGNKSHRKMGLLQPWLRQPPWALRAFFSLSVYKSMIFNRGCLELRNATCGPEASRESMIQL